MAGYIDFWQHLGRWLTLEAGLRVDYHTHVGAEWVLQADLSFYLPKDAELKLLVGKGFRYPTIREMYMFRPANLDLQPERICNYKLAFSQRLTEGRLTYGLNVFYIDGENLIQRMPVDGRALNINTGQIENAGFETQVGYRISDVWSVDANYSYLYMEYPVVAAPGHKLYTGASFVKARWSATTGVQYVAELYTATEPEDTEDFVLWNLRASFRTLDWLSIWVRGENLLVRKYEINAGFPMPWATMMTGINVDF